MKVQWRYVGSSNNQNSSAQFNDNLLSIHFISDHLYQKLLLSPFITWKSIKNLTIRHQNKMTMRIFRMIYVWRTKCLMMQIHLITLFKRICINLNCLRNLIGIQLFDMFLVSKTWWTHWCLMFQNLLFITALNLW